MLPNMVWMRGNTSRQAEQLIDYIQDGIDKGYSSFSTYKRSNEIFKLINENIEYSLLSDDPFVRSVAGQIIKKSQS